MHFCPEGGGIMSLRNVVPTYQTTWYHSAEGHNANLVNFTLFVACKPFAVSTAALRLILRKRTVKEEKSS